MMNTQIGSLMLIDDNSIDQVLYKRIIDRSGLVTSLVQCNCAELALEKLRKDQLPDAILLDINMPKINGFEFLDMAIEEFGGKFSIVVIMLTTSLNPADSERAAQYEVVKDYFQKPLEIAQLERVSQLVNA